MSDVLIFRMLNSVGSDTKTDSNISTLEMRNLQHAKNGDEALRLRLTATRSRIRQIHLDWLCAQIYDDDSLLLLLLLPLSILFLFNFFAFFIFFFCTYSIFLSGFLAYFWCS